MWAFSAGLFTCGHALRCITQLWSAPIRFTLYIAHAWLDFAAGVDTNCKDRAYAHVLYILLMANLHLRSGGQRTLEGRLILRSIFELIGTCTNKARSHTFTAIDKHRLTRSSQLQSRETPFQHPNRQYGEYSCGEKILNTHFVSGRRCKCRQPRIVGNPGHWGPAQRCRTRCA